MRATWKGFLKLSLVTIPIKVFPATDSAAALAFNQLHEPCSGRVTQRRWCVNCAREVPSLEIVKGYEFEKGRYVVLSDQDLEQVKPVSTRVIDLVRFSAFAALDPIHIDRTYYLAPDGAGAAEAFDVLAVAMREYVGVGTLALYGREYLVAVRSTADRLTLHTLHHAAEIRPMDAIEELRARPGPTDPAQIKLARQVIDALAAPLDLADFTDAYRAGVLRVIDAKIAGEEIVIAPAPALPRVLGLRDALVQSLAAVKATPAKKFPVKAALKKRRAS